MLPHFADQHLAAVPIGILLPVLILILAPVFRLIPDVMLPTPEGTTQIDHVIVSRYGIFVLETKNYKGWIIKDEQVPEIADVIRQWAGTVTEQQKAGHVAHLQQNRREVGVCAAVPACPRCQELMILRTSRRDGCRFWGCTKFPACRGTRQAA